MGTSDETVPMTVPATSSPPNDISPPKPVPVRMTDLNIGGSILLTICVIFTLVNGFLIWLAFCKNWSIITRSKFFNSFFLGLALSLADLILAVLVGFPASLHLTWMSYFREQPSMQYYSMYIGHFLFVFISHFRVLIIALLSLDSFLHIMFPFQYEAGYDCRKRAYIACGFAAAIPFLLKIISGLFLLHSYESEISCIQYKDLNASVFDETGTPSLFYVPLNCEIRLPSGKHDIVKADVAVTSTIIVISWLILDITNVVSFITATLKLWNSPARTSMTDIARASLVICFTSLTFAASNFPTVVVSLMSYYANNGYDHYQSAYVNDRIKFYLTLLSFLSLIFHPWFFVLRLKSFREILTSFTNAVLGSRDSSGDYHLARFYKSTSV